MTRIDDNALLGDARTTALVNPDSSLDWMCLARFDSPAGLSNCQRRPPWELFFDEQAHGVHADVELFFMHRHCRPR